MNYLTCGNNIFRLNDLKRFGLPKSFLEKFKTYFEGFLKSTFHNQIKNIFLRKHQPQEKCRKGQIFSFENLKLLNLVTFLPKFTIKSY